MLATTGDLWGCDGDVRARGGHGSGHRSGGCAAQDNPAGPARLRADGAGRGCAGARREHVVDVDGVGIHVESAGPEGVHRASSACTASRRAPFTWAGIAPVAARRAAGWWPGTGRPSGAAIGPRPGAGRRPLRPGRRPAALQRSCSTGCDGGAPCPVLVGHSAGALLAMQVALDRRAASRRARARSRRPSTPGRRRPSGRSAGCPARALVAASMLRAGALGAATVPAPLHPARHPAHRCHRRGDRPVPAPTGHGRGALAPDHHVGAAGRAGTGWARSASRRWSSGASTTASSRRQPAPGVAAELLGADLHLLQGAGHAPHEQQPAVVAGVIRDFVAAL